jgi:hypothetical protein
VNKQRGIGGAVRPQAGVRSFAASVVGAALLLVGVLTGLGGGASALAGPSSSGSWSGSGSSSSSTPTLAGAGFRSTASPSERRPSGVLRSSDPLRLVAGSAPVDPPLGELPSPAWRQPAQQAHFIQDGETFGFAVSVPGRQQSRAPPAGTALV